jgi:phosphopantothenoylcysteine decarboxylase/phosphopantothenate--cysteine ligase
MGYSMAAAFLDAGADVVLVSGPCGSLPSPGASETISVESAEELQSAVEEVLPGSDLLAMAAAVSDFRPVRTSEGKLKRSGEGLDIHLEATPDILRTVSGFGSGTRLLAFALEYGPDAEEKALAKMREKGADAVFMNRGDVAGQGMESPANSGILLFPGGERTVIPAGSKRFVAEAIVAALGRHFGGTAEQAGEP